jgi:polysaccharide deacetylase family protein (PEP-CTERM system associated)
MPGSMLNALTVDVEDYFQVTSFDRVVSRATWDSRESRVVASTQRLLDLFARHRVRGTFFVLGWVAERFPQLVRRIAAAGHELGCHSYWHRLIYDLDEAAFRADLRQARQAIEDAAGQPVTAFRAPSFSITRRSLWALDVLVQEGFTIDSSIFPTAHDRYGVRGAAPHATIVETPAGPIAELPMTVASFGRVSVPVGGGGYFRLYPLALTRRLLARVNSVHERPFVFYIHPWEVDPDQPRIRGGSLASRFRHYVNLRSTESKLDRLLGRFRWGTVSEVVQQSLGSQSLTRRLPEPSFVPADAAARE